MVREYEINVYSQLFARRWTLPITVSASWFDRMFGSIHSLYTGRTRDFRWTSLCMGSLGYCFTFNRICSFFVNMFCDLALAHPCDVIQYSVDKEYFTLQFVWKIHEVYKFHLIGLRNIKYWHLEDTSWS